MSIKKKKKLTPVQQEYQKFAQEREPKRPILFNCVKAFFVGGFICTLGQGIQMFFIKYFHFSQEAAANPTVAVIIIITVLLTGFGVFDHIAQFAGAGTVIPITGFANTMASAAIEHRTEGFVLGVGGNMFKLSGPVIVYGVFSAFVVSLLVISLRALGVM
ncbi:stage V sporulation protein AC [Desulfosporosinus lacus]|uniref:Stage V sporulation protein AC n=1 Tax=Desulfosporosinus lacus DSM 15449 TaxID=1121420 RepID=A0A1M6H4E7_9FIRM|nr:stage V sporulation protein AC [Desulfosporosinus lacus]SHJ17101.1 stage V sporulation protein AC [Desulfosporosinus lacus DSM 15449]